MGTTGRTWEDFTCAEWAADIPLSNSNYTAFGPKNASSMEACKAYIQDPSNVWDEEKTSMGFPLEFVGACSWPPESFASAMDMWLETRSRANPYQMQMNEISLDLEANSPGSVEALYVTNTPYGMIGRPEAIEFQNKMGSIVDE